MTPKKEKQCTSSTCHWHVILSHYSELDYLYIVTGNTCKEFVHANGLSCSRRQMKCSNQNKLTSRSKLAKSTVSTLRANGPVFVLWYSRYENHGQTTKTAELPSITPNLYRQHQNPSTIIAEIICLNLISTLLTTSTRWNKFQIQREHGCTNL